MSRAKGIEDLYPLSPLQEGMLFHHLYAPQQDPHFHQLRCKLRGSFERGLFYRAWQHVVDRHQPLRTAFALKARARPVQAVYRQVEMPRCEIDLRRLSETDREAQTRGFLRRDLARGFVFSAAPLTRIALLRLEDASWQLVWSYHHVLLDGWSVAQIFRELFGAYQALVAGRPPQLPPTRPFGDYVAWLQRQDPAAAEDFWRRRMEGFSAPTLLASERVAAGAPDARARDFLIHLPEPVAAGLRGFAARQRLTLASVIQGTWALLLSRYTGRDDVVFGNVVSGRPPELQGVERMVGMLINTQPLRVRVLGSAPLAEWLRELQARESAARRYEHTPLVDIQRWSAVAAGEPLFDTLLAIENFPTPEGGGGRGGALEVSEVSSVEGRSYPLSLMVGAAAHLYLRLHYAPGRFTATAALRLLRHFVNLLTALPACDEHRVGELDLLSPAERHQLLVEWNDTESGWPHGATLAELLETRAEQRPDAVAAVATAVGAWLSYGTLARRAQAVAGRLRAAGVGVETPVVLFAERSLEMLVATLGILRAGGAYVPLDAGNPAERLAFLVADCGAPVVLAQRALAERLPATPARVLAIEAASEPAGTPVPMPRCGSEALAYVMYTSGSTGEPKGVAVCQRGVLRLVHAPRFAPMESEASYLQAAPASFDAATLEIWAPLANGGRVVLAPAEQLSTGDLGRLVERERVSHLWLTAGLFHAMVDHGIERLRGLRRLLAGGDVLSPPHALRALAELPATVLVDGYGPTENTTFTCCHPLGTGEGAGAAVPIGRPIAATRVAILDRDLRPLPIGVAGQLGAGGDGLARGYHRRPATTAAVFVPDPVSRAAGERLYLTGDLARRRADGVVEFLGRIDTQLKIRGFRVEPGEVESVLRARPEITDAVVLLRDQRLVAFVVGTVEPGLREALREKLPDYMVPALVVELPALPLNANGKVDRAALGRAALGRAALGRAALRTLALPSEPGAGGEFAAPRTLIEERLAAIWAEVLGVARVGVADSFFELGGHSLLATQTISRLREAFGVELPLRVLFETPRLDQVAEQIAAAQIAERRHAAPPLVARPHGARVELSFAQQRLWFLDRLLPGGTAYNLPAALRLLGPLDAVALERAFGELVRRHEVLRTTFAEEGGVARQVIRPAVGWTLPVVDLGRLDAPVAVARRLADAEAVRVFDLEQGPLLRVALLRFSAREHLLLVTLHHVASDGWSVGVMLREIAALYRGETLPELPVQYADFALWQRGWLTGEVLESQLAYWRRQLAELPPLELPSDRPRPPVLSQRAGTMVVRQLPLALADQLEKLARASGATLFMTLTAALAAVLARWSGRHDFAIGTPISGRTHLGLEGLIGFFVNTLALRAEVETSASFAEQLARMRRVLLEAYEHQDVPFESLVSALAPEQDLSRPPLFQVLFSLVETQPPLALPGIEAGSWPQRTGGVKLDLEVAAMHGAGGLGLSFAYRADLFDRTTIQRLARVLARALAAVAEMPAAPLASLDLLGSAQRHQMLAEWNDVAVAKDEGLLVHQRCLRQAERSPDAVAVEHGAAQLSYGELAARARRLARELRAMGLAPESRVGILLARDPDLIVALLGVLASGAAYVGLDPAYPEERLRFMTEDAGLAAILRPEGVERLQPSGSSGSGAVHEGNPAWLIYTSGSTGRPKGVTITHRGGAALLGWAAGAFGDPELGAVLAATSVCFDLSIFEIFVPLACGGRVVLVANALGFAELAGRERVTLINTVPSAAAELLRLGVLGAIGTVNLAGELLEPWLVAALERAGVGRINDLYGPSEDTTYSTWTRRHARASATIGRPLAGGRAHVLDRALRPLPLGSAGEICLGGAGLARGYHARPAMTAERFVPDPLAGLPGERLYRTGDLGRHLADGSLQLLGRIDTQVKIRGFRVELGEVEAALGRCAGVREAAALAQRGAPGAPARLVAWVVGQVTVAALREQLRAGLPDYMVPSLFVELAALPRLPNGKVDRKRLPAPDLAAAETERPFVAPRNPTEKTIAEIWREVLKVERVGIDDSFFELGGHSLLATQAVSRIHAVLGVELPLRRFFTAPTVREQAVAALELAAQADPSKRWKSAREQPIHRRPAASTVPLSFAQHRLWFLHQLAPESPFYNMPRALHFRGSLDGEILRRTFGEIVRRHEILRTCFRVEGGEPVQVIAPALEIALPIVDLGALARPEKVARALGERFLRQPFDLERLPLLRLQLVRLDAEEHVLFLVVHHIVFDGWSQRVLQNEVTQIYGAFAAGQPSPLAEPEIQYADFAVWQRGWLDEAVLAEQLAYWKTLTAGAPELLELPTDRPRPAIQSLAGAHLHFGLSAASTAQLRAFSDRRGLSLYMTLFAVFQVVLARWSGREDLVVGSPIANRNKAELENLLGFFVNMLLRRSDLTGDPSFEELLTRVRDLTLDAYDRQDLPFERLVAELKPERNLAYTPLFQVMFNQLAFPRPAGGLSELSIGSWAIDTATSKYDLSLYFFGSGEGALPGLIEYGTALFDRATIARLWGHYRNVVETVLAAPGTRLADLPLMAPAERHALLVERNAVGAAHTAAGEGVHRLIAERARRAPDAVALVMGGEAISHGALQARARKIASGLRARGVGPEVWVGVSMPRSIDMVAALLGVLEAGGAYVPLDPSYPEARLAMMIDDARPRVVLRELVLGDGELFSQEVLPGQLAYVIYTSGSTGNPKGVAVGHRSLVAFLRAMAERPGLAEGDVFVAVTTLSFDIAGLELYLPLLAGARLVLASEEETADAGLLAGLLARERASAMQATPATWNLLTATDSLRPGALRKILCGGEALPRRLADRLLASAAEVWNVYGPTETTIWSAVERVSQRRAIALGIPIAGTSCYVLDRQGGLVPLGVAGELMIGGAGLARGYLARPALTAERFLPDPFRGEGAGEGARLYRTGDLVRYRAQGGLQFLGRIDNQVKVRGFRIELGEIESVLARHPEVRAVVVGVRRRGGSGDQLVAWLESDTAPSVEALQDFSAQHLPDYMVPSAFVVLENFPKTPAGKVDRKALPDPEGGRQGLSTDYRAPETALERFLAEAWRGVLGIDQVGVDDRFFNLGGSSIQAAIFTNHLQQALGEIVHVMALFRHQTIAELAAFLEREYTAALPRLGIESAAPAALGRERGIEAEQVVALRRLVARSRPAVRHVAGKRAAGPIFVLSPPRAGSTLLRVMLAGHPKLFAPPELELLSFNTLGERRRAFTGAHSFGAEGLLRAVMELRGCDAATARALLARYESEDLDVGAFYAQLEAWCGGRRLVDKTTTYALDPAALQRAEEIFDGAFYLHLLRHPCATLKSYVDVRLDQFLRFENDFTGRQQAELLWSIDHQNILQFLRAVPAERQHRLRFEDLLRDPEAVSRELCARLGLDFDPAMLEPYSGRRMTDGVHAESRMHGDPRFHEHRGIDAAVAEKWRGAYRWRDLAPLTRQLAVELGYAGEEELGAGGLRPTAASADLPLSFAQQRLWFLDRLEPGGVSYNIPAAVRFEGRLEVEALAAALGEVVRRHAVLRTTFSEQDGVAMQSWAPWTPGTTWTLPLIDLSRVGGGFERQRLASAEARRPFDLARGPLLRAQLVRLSPEAHLLSVTMHHIVSDGWSIGVLVREVALLYTALTADPVLPAPSPLPELAVQYGDFALWQRAQLSGASLERQLAFWRAQLAGVPALELPTDRPRPPVASSRGASYRLHWPAELAAGLHALGRGRGATLFMTLLAGVEALLARWSGQGDFALGTPVAGRHHAALEPMIGFFVNTLVVRSDAGAGSFGALLERVRARALEVFAHQGVPFEQLVSALDQEIERDLGRTPLFQVLFALQNAPASSFELPGLRLFAVPQHTGTTKFDLEVALAEAGGRLHGRIDFATALFDPTTIARLAGSFETLLASVTKNPEQPLAALELLSPAQRHQLLLGANDTPSVEPGQSCLHELFERQAERAPDAVALTLGGEQLSYGELDRLAARLAHRLRRAGVGPEVRVAVCLERSLEMIVALVGILKAGGAYVPLDPAQPAERRASMLEDARPCVVLGASDLSDLSDESDRSDFRSPADTGDQLAYVIYTSGSTGKPKGVEVTHASVVALLAATHPAFRFDAGDVWTLFHSYAFDFSVWELWGALAYGGRLVVVPYWESRSPSALVEILERERVTVLNQTPSAFRQLVEVESRLAALRWVIFGGEALVPASLAPWLDRHGDRHPRLVNMYGITETTVHVSWRPLARADLALGGRSPIGRAIAGWRLVVLDRGLQPVPFGVSGELCVGGLGLARGYLARPGLAAERFVPDPFGGEPGARLYRSGDLGRWLARGEVEHLGRIDHQVKIRGFRIELGEIESALRDQPEISDAVVLLRDQTLVAYVAGSPAPELREALRAKLPDYMVPTTVVALPALPLNAHGKVDRAALRALAPAAQVGSAADFVPPRDAVEELLAGLWSQVLGVEPIGAHDNFFALGGHSLLATRLVSRIRQVFHAELELRVIFEHPTVSELALALTRAGRAGRPAAPVACALDEPAPLSFAQQRLWFLDRLEPGRATYNIPVAMRLAGTLDAAALAAALAEVVRRHEVLRTTVVEVAGEPCQQVHPPPPPVLAWVDLSRLDPPLRAATLAGLAAAEAARPFDLGRDRPLRAAGVRLGVEDHAVLLTQHHIASDGWSVGLLVEEVTTLYEAFAARRPSPLAELPLQYGDFARWQREQLRGEVLEREMGYWRRQLAGAPALLELPTDRPRPPIARQRGAAARVVLPADLSARLHAFCREHAATPFMVLLAGFQALLARWSGRADLCVGTPIAGRLHVEVERLIGLFLNTLVLRCDLRTIEPAADPCFAELVYRTRETALDAYAHQVLPFERLVEVLEPERSLSFMPLFQVSFALQNAPVSEVVKVAGLTMRPLQAPVKSAKFDLSLLLAQSPNGIFGSMEYNSDLFDTTTAQRLGGWLRNLLSEALARPHERIGRLGWLTAAQRHQLLLAWNDTAADAGAPASLHGRIARQTAATPDAVAVLAQDGALSYGELERRAAGLAHQLIGLGVGPERVVAICAERSLELMVGLVAILETGGAYLPLDPDYPADRLATMLALSGSAVVLVQDHLRARLPEVAGVRRLRLAAAAVPGRTRPGIAVDGDNLAYVIYTSGSTGRPKGVMNSHRAICNRLAWLPFEGALSAADRVLQKTPYSFDVSIWELFWPLLYGGSVAMAIPGGHRDPVYLAAVIRQQRVTVVHFVSSLLRVFAEEPSAAQCSSLRWVVASGEALPADLVRLFFARLPGRLLNLYGPTEAAIEVSWHDCEPADGTRPVVPIGRPISNLHLHVLDCDLEPSPIGAIGELFIGGVAPARGYHGEAGRAAERFVPDPVAGAGARLYRTGDLARHRADGAIEFLGRTDHQVKLRGFRIELGEIETALESRPEIAEAVVLLHDQLLVAYVVGTVAPGLREALREQLPDYMVPAVIVELAVLPLLSSGKVDRAALRKLALPARPDAEGGFAPPRTPHEEFLAAIWGEVLGREQVGIDDDFFTIGGHSLAAMRVVARVRAVFGVELPLRHLFATPTVRRLASVLAELAAAALRDVPPPPLLPALLTGPAPLSFAQQRLWFLHQLDPLSAAFNIAVAIRLKGRLRVEILAAGLRAIVDRHQALRTRFVLAAHEPVQQVDDTVLELPQVDLRALAETHRRGVRTMLLAREGARPFDLGCSPLLRALLLRTGEGEHVLALTLHHVASDGWSMGVLTRELVEHYRAGCAGTLPALPALPIQYADFAVWQRRWLTGETLERYLDHWRRRLGEESPGLALPRDRRPPARPSQRGAACATAFGRDLSRALVELGRREGTTVFMTVLAALKAFLSVWSPGESVTIGTDVAGRNHVELENLIGFFVNVLPLRTDLSGDPTFRELLARVRETTLDAYAHQDLPFDTLVDELQPRRALGETPFFQVLFVHQNLPRSEIRLPDLILEPLATPDDSSKFELMLVLREGENGLAGTWVYRTELFDSATVDHLAKSFRDLLARAVAEPDLPLHRLAAHGAGLFAVHQGETSMSTVETLPVPQLTTIPRRGRARGKGTRFADGRTDGDLVSLRQLLPDSKLPLVIEPALPDVDLVEWAQAEKEMLEERLLEHGGILLRGFGVSTAGELERFAQVLCPELYDGYGDLPREVLGEKIYHSTPYPPEKTILYHNESSQMPTWPRKQIFCCLQPAEQGGETPIVDGRRVYARLSEALRRPFEEKGLLYVRNFVEGLDVSWQEFFATDERAEVERTCRRLGLEAEWREDGQLRTKRWAPAVIVHPLTGETAFFNQILAHHISCLEPEEQESLLKLFGQDGLPRNVYYGDGTPIPAAVVAELVAIYDELAVVFPWQQGDVVVLDNMLTSHSRNPFVGARKVIVAMGEMTRAEDVLHPATVMP